MPHDETKANGKASSNANLNPGLLTTESVFLFIHLKSHERSVNEQRDILILPSYHRLLNTCIFYVYSVHYHLSVWCFIHFSNTYVLKVFYFQTFYIGDIAVNKTNIIPIFKEFTCQREIGAIYTAGQKP